MTTLSIDPNADVPPYEQLRQQLIEQIRTGQLPAHTRLPAVRRLAADLAIAPGTVARAYTELKADGYLITRGRNGTVVAPLPAIGTNAQERGRQISAEYVRTMHALGFEDHAIVDEVRKALPGS